MHDFTAPFYLYLKTRTEVDMIRKGSEFDTDGIEYHSKLAGFSFDHLVWTKDFKLIVNRDSCIKLEDQNLETEAICDSF